jgi:hypothetical protein
LSLEISKSGGYRGIAGIEWESPEDLAHTIKSCLYLTPTILFESPPENSMAVIMCGFGFVFLNIKTTIFK